MNRNKNQVRTITREQKILILLIFLSIAAIGIFVLPGLNANNFDFNFPRRMKKIAAMLLVSICVGYSSVVFQTITENRILTPSVMGLDSLYLFIQTLIAFLFGADKLVLMDSSKHFILSAGIIMAASLLIFRVVFHNDNRNIYTLVLVGMITGTFFRGISSFLEMMIDPNEFNILQGKMFASFKNVDERLLLVSFFIVLVALILSRKDISRFDVLGLGVCLYGFGRAHYVPWNFAGQLIERTYEDLSAHLLNCRFHTNWVRISSSWTVSVRTNL